MISRRQFGRLSGLGLVSMLVSGWMSCEKANDLIGSLRGIVQAVEHALGLLSVMQGLLPDVVNTAAKYLIAVVQFVDDVARLLEDQTQSAVDKANQILQWAVPLVVPTIANQQVATIIKAVAGAVNHFLSFFGTDQEHAGATARARTGKVPNMDFNDKQRAELGDIDKFALREKNDVEDWQKRAMATPH